MRASVSPARVIMRSVASIRMRRSATATTADLPLPVPRTKGNVARLAAVTLQCETYIFEGGLDAWRNAGLPVALDRKQPIEIMRQVQSQPSLVLLGVVIGAFVAPGFYTLSGFVGAACYLLA